MYCLKINSESKLAIMLRETELNKAIKLNKYNYIIE
jgi:hypothetical protein